MSGQNENTNTDTNTNDTQQVDISTLSDKEFNELISDPNANQIAPEDNTTNEDENSQNNQEDINTKYEEVDDNNRIDDESKEDNSSSDNIQDTNENQQQSEKQDTETKDLNIPDGYLKSEDVLAPIKADGKEITPDSIDKLRQWASLGIHSAQKLQTIKKWQPFVRALQENGLDNVENLNIAIDAFKGNKQAILKLAEMNNIDLTSQDENQENKDEYIPNDNVVTGNAFQMKEVISQLEKDEIFNQKTLPAIKEQFDENSVQAFVDNPQLLIEFNNQVRNGTYDKISSEIALQEALGNNIPGNNFIEKYIYIESQLAQDQQSNNNTSNKSNNNKIDENEIKRGVTKQNKQSSNKRTSVPEQVDFASMTDKEFEEYSRKHNI